MKEKNKKQKTESKDLLSHRDLIASANTFELPALPHPALETPDGKNNGAEPAVFHNQRKSQT